MFLIRDTQGSINVPDHKFQKNKYHFRSFKGKIQELVYEKLYINAIFETDCHSHTYGK